MGIIVATLSSSVFSLWASVNLSADREVPCPCGEELCLNGGSFHHGDTETTEIHRGTIVYVLPFSVLKSIRYPLLVSTLANLAFSFFL
jgi:hypothetical protein